MQSFLDDGHQNVDAHCYEDLCLDRIFARSEKGLDPQMLFDPAKEQFDLPAAFVELRDGQSRDHMVVGQETQSFSRIGIDKVNQTQLVGVIPERVES